MCTHVYDRKSHVPSSNGLSATAMLLFPMLHFSSIGYRTKFQKPIIRAASVTSTSEVSTAAMLIQNRNMKG
jgi:hypothetical protein